MSNYPTWAWPKPGHQANQVSSGLNLTLELKPIPNKLPLLLWDILLAQEKIKRALEELSFVHFARFVPSWDAKALMVITEFDGPLDPYVLDFVIALGDVFDVLLSYVKDPPALPVREHPDEFLVWVRKWNRVPFYPSTLRKDFKFCEGFNYPVYSAYPHKTVTDIAGCRATSLAPALDHPAASVDLSDVQGNILKGYGATHGRYLLFKVTDAARARRWLSQHLPDPHTPWHGITNAELWAGAGPEVLTQVAFTHAGLQSLLAPAFADDLKLFPEAFRQGAAARANENFDRGCSAPTNWIFGGATDPVHVMLFLYTKELVAPQAYLNAVAALESRQEHGLQHLRSFAGERLSADLTVVSGADDKRYGKEPFGFVDGISDPQISGQAPGPEPAFQPAASPGEFLLHKDYKSIYRGSSLGGMPEWLASNGSFGVLRLMEQDVALFNERTASEAARLGVCPELLRAKLMGRWKDGTPLALSPNVPQAMPTNAFDYAPSWEFPDEVNDHEGKLCPVGAHVRRVYPRTARVAGQRHSRRLLRRGMAAKWSDQGQEKVGLMGLFMGASIEQQFEFIQREWIQGDLAASGIRGTTDPIAAIRDADTEFSFLVPGPAGDQAPQRRHVANIPPVVQTRGCLYLFFPGLKALRQLHCRDPARAARVEDGPYDEAADADVHSDKPRKVAAAAARAVKRARGVARAVSRGQPKRIDVSRILDFDRDLDELRSVPALAGLAGGKWWELINDLRTRNLGSQWFKTIIDAIAPASKPMCPPAGVPVVDIDLADPSVCGNPFDVLKTLRDRGLRTVWVPAQQACWVLGHADCKDLLNRHADFGQAPAGTEQRGIVTLDQPRHTKVRDAYAAAFTAALAASATEGDVTAAVDAALKKLTANPRLKQFDFMQDYAHPVARSVIWHLIGIDDEDERQTCDALANTLVLHHGKRAEADDALRLVAADAGLRLAARLVVPLSRAWLSSSTGGTKGTLIGELAARMKPGPDSPHARELGFIETLITLVQTVLASQSPHFLLGSAAWHLLSPDLRPGKGASIPWAELHKIPGDRGAFKAALDSALDEARRCEPPLTLIERYARGDQCVGGVRVPDGCAVFAVVASANRDESVYGPAAEQFHADRSLVRGQLLSLGHGIHLCAGQELQARLVPAALGGIIQAMGDLRLRNPQARPAWHATVSFRVLQALSVMRKTP